MSKFRDFIRELVEADDKVLDRDPDLKKKEKVGKPKMFRVVLYNSDDVDGNLVMELLKKHFNKTDAESYQIVMGVHHSGSGTVGVYTKDVAETKTDAMVADGQDEGYHINMTVEPE